MATALATAASTSFHFRDVALDEDRVGSQVLHHLEGLVPALLDYVGQRQFRPLTREDARGRLPDTRTGTGNQRHFAVQYSRHVKSSSEQSRERCLQAPWRVGSSTRVPSRETRPARLDTARPPIYCVCSRTNVII